MSLTMDVKVAKTCTEALKLLWADGFFADWKDWAAIVEALGELGNHFASTALGKALERAKYLTRRGRRGAYMYIQKYPAAADTGDEE